LGPEFTVKLRVIALATEVDVQTFTAFPAEPGFVLLTDPDRVPLRMILAVHLSSPSTILNEKLPWVKEKFSPFFAVLSYSYWFLYRLKKGFDKHKRSG
jgi:hypothetical protein